MIDALHSIGMSNGMITSAVITIILCAVSIVAGRRLQTVPSGFQNFAHSAGKFAFGKGSQCRHVHIDQPGLMKSPNHIFILSEINSGFSSYTAVYLSEQCGGNLDKINTSQISRSTKSGKISGYATSQSHY